jgi:hypothetical protein
VGHIARGTLAFAVDDQVKVEGEGLRRAVYDAPLPQ